MENFQDTIIIQYENSPTISQIISNWNTYLDPTAVMASFYYNVFNLATAQGFGLDIWGVILGIGRVVQVGNFAYFGFQGPVTASGTGFNNGPFAVAGESLTSNYELSDGQYRALLFAKAEYNISDCSIGSLNQLLINLFGPTGPFPIPGNCYVTDGLNMTMTYTFPTGLSLLQAAIVNSGILPKPAGVSVAIIQ